RVSQDRRVSAVRPGEARRDREDRRLRRARRIVTRLSKLRSSRGRSSTRPAIPTRSRWHSACPAISRRSMADDHLTNTLHARAIAIAVAAREQVLAAARVEIERLRSAIDSIEPDVADAVAQPTAGAQLLTTVADVFGEFFSRVLVGAADADGFTVWHSRGFDPPPPRHTVLRPAADSPLAHATAEWGAFTSETAAGVLGAPTRYAIALPLVAKGRGAAMVYAENAPSSAADDRIASKIAAILAETVRPRLHVKAAATAAAPVEPSVPQKQRQARRVKMLDS